MITVNEDNKPTDDGETAGEENKMKLYMKTFNSFEDYEENAPYYYRNDTAYVIRENGWIKADMETNAASAKTAVRRFFKAIDPAGEGVGFGRWCFECVVDDNGDPIAKMDDRTLANGEKNPDYSYVWGCEEIDDGVWYVYLNCLDETTEAAETGEKETAGQRPERETQMTYLKQMTEDVIDYIRENEIEVTKSNRDEIAEMLNDDLWVEDSVTGNASGSYHFSTAKAQAQVIEDGMQYIPDMVSEFGIDAKTVAEHLTNGDWEWWDVSIRCYLLGDAIQAALDMLLA